MAADTTNAFPLEHDILPTARPHFLGEAVARFTGCERSWLLQNSAKAFVWGRWQPKWICLLTITLLFTGFWTSCDHVLTEPKSSATATVVSSL